MSRMPSGPRRCDLCGIEPGELQLGKPVIILRFALVYFIVVAGRQTSRAVGTLLICQHCWDTGPALRRRRPGTGRPRRYGAGLEVAPPTLDGPRPVVEPVPV